MRSYIVAAVIALSLASSPAEGSDDTPAIEGMMPLLADLAAQGGYGIGHSEQGAFLVRGPDGAVRCQLWPSSSDFRRTSHTGPIPRGTIAIAHTHPRCCPHASAHDKREADRLGIPIIAVSMGTMHLVTANGTADRPRHGIRWSGHLDAMQKCRDASDPRARQSAGR